jgi:hypothetical protein
LGNGKINVMIVYGKTEKAIVGMEEWYFKGGFVTKAFSCGAGFLLGRVTEWYRWANK